MLFLEISGCEGLRDIDTKYRNVSKVSKDFNIPTYSRVSRLNKNKSSDSFRNIFEDLLLKAEKEIKSSVKIKDYKDIQIIDSSVVSIGKGLAPELYLQDEKSAIRISTLLSLEINYLKR